jgi:serine phosphatase RsbU (regulator of sigma subunit)
MDRNEIQLIKKKYRNNYAARIAWSALMLVIVTYIFSGMIILLTAVHLGISIIWAALVEFEAPVIFIEDLRYLRITLDAFLYTLAIYITGGVNSFVLLSYIIFIMLASLYSTNRYGIFAITVCVLFYNAMLLLTYSGYLPQVNIFSVEGYVKITTATVLFTNFLLVFVSVILSIAAHSLYKNLMDRTSELQVERNLLKNRNEIIENDMILARRIQEQLIPKESPYSFIHALYKPMEQVGGDFFDFFDFRDTSRTGIFLSDVSGHGVPAAFITSMIKTMILQSGLLRENPAGLLTYLNGLLYGKTAENFITAFYGIIDRDSRTIIFSNAGHNLPFLIAEDGIHTLNDARSIPLAIAGNTFLETTGKVYENSEIKLSSGDRIIFYTDGLTEENGSDGVHESFEDLMLEEILPHLRKLSCRQSVEELHKRLITWSGSENFTDDVCVICVEI